jgi:ribosomal protein S18 acetylase RimI-like enzyme
MDVRRLTPADAAAYQAIRLAGLREAPSAFAASYEQERMVPLSTYEERLAALPDRGSFGAFDGQDLVGIVTLGRESKSRLLHKAHIWGMYVRPDVRARGIARTLLVRAIELARTVPEIRQVNVSVNAANVRALRLYESAGFRTFGREVGSLRVDGELHDELHMCLPLAGG